MPGTPVTDTRNDPRYWEALLTHINPHYREQARINLERINQERTQNRSLGASHEALMENIRSREQTGRLARQQMSQRDRENAAYHREQLAQRGEAAAARQQAAELAQLTKLADLIPEINLQYGEKGKEYSKAIMGQLLKRSGIGGTPGGAPPSDTEKAASEAWQRVAAQAGEKTVTPPATGGQPVAAGQAPAAAGGIQRAPAASGQFAPADLSAAPARQQTGYHWFAGTGGLTGGNNATMVKYYDDGTQEVVPASSIPGQEPDQLNPVRRNVEGGQINPEFARERGIQPGYDFNFNTGQMVPKDLVGTINGKPAPQALAEGAVRSGKSPIYSERAMAVLDEMRRDTGEKTVQGSTGGGGSPGGPAGIGAMVAARGGMEGTQQRPENAPIMEQQVVDTSGETPGGGVMPPQKQEEPPVFSPGSTARTTGPAGAPTFGMVGDVIKGAGQGLLPSVFGQPPGTPGAEAVAQRQAEIARKQAEEEARRQAEENARKGQQG